MAKFLNLSKNEEESVKVEIKVLKRGKFDIKKIYFFARQNYEKSLMLLIYLPLRII